MIKLNIMFLMLLQLVNFIFAIKLSSDFYDVQKSTNVEKIILKPALATTSIKQ
jgi:hypothetical protein